MKYGLCGGPELGACASAAGFDYLEINVQKHLAPEQDEAAFAAQRRQMAQSPVPVEAANCMIPGHLKICGPAVDRVRLERYVETLGIRAERVGVRVIVFGSGGARAIPEGFDRREGWRQLVEFGRNLGGIAQRHGVTIAVEPLRRRECNILNTVAEAAGYVREVAHPAIRLLVDSFHWGEENESPQAIVEAGDLLSHVHVATLSHRMAPGLEPHDFGPFFRALKQVKYDGRVSIEATFNDLAAEAAASRRALAEAVAAA